MLSQRDKQLLDAALIGNIYNVQLALEQGANVNAMDDKNNTALLLALNGDHFDIMRLLMQHGADVTYKNKKGENALINAIRFAVDKSIVAQLIHHGAQFDSKIFEFAWHNNLASLQSLQSLCRTTDKCGQTILHYAAAAGHLSILQWAINDLGMDASITDNKSCTPLRYTAWNGHIEAFEWLVKQKKCGVFEKYGQGYTLLYTITLNNHLKLAQLLIEKYGFTGNEKDNHGTTPLHIAGMSGYLELAQYYLSLNPRTLYDEDDRGNNVFHHAAINGQVPTLKHLIEKDASLLEKQNKNGLTAFKLAAVYGRLEAVKWFTQLSQDEDEKFAVLKMAIKNDEREVVEWFIREGGCDAKKTFATNESNILHWACLNNSPKVAEWILDNVDIDPSAQNNQGATSLHYAAHSGNVDIVKRLVEKCPTLTSVRDRHIETPVFYAASAHKNNVVHFLVDHDHIDVSHYTAAYLLRLLHISSAAGNDELIPWLLEKGDASELYRDDIHSPLQYARQFNKLTTISLLLKLGTGMKEDLSGIDLTQIDTKNCILIGATANGQPLQQIEGSIQTADQLLALPKTQLAELNLPILRKIVNRLCTLHENDSELLKIQNFLNGMYNEELKSAIRNGATLDWDHIRQQALAQLKVQPNDNQLIQTTRIAGSLSSLRNHSRLFCAENLSQCPNYQTVLPQELASEVKECADRLLKH